MEVPKVGSVMLLEVKAAAVEQEGGGESGGGSAVGAGGAGGGGVWLTCDMRFSSWRVFSRSNFSCSSSWLVATSWSDVQPRKNDREKEACGGQSSLV